MGGNPNEFYSMEEKEAMADEIQDSTDNRDYCWVCGIEIPPGPDFCSDVCETKATANRPKRCPECLSDDPTDPGDVQAKDENGQEMPWDAICQNPWHDKGKK